MAAAEEPSVASIIARQQFDTRESWEITVEKLLGHWAHDIKRRIAEHEAHANTAMLLNVAQLPLMVFALFMAVICPTVDAETRAGAFWVLAIGQVHDASPAHIPAQRTATLGATHGPHKRASFPPAPRWRLNRRRHSCALQMVMLYLDPSGWRERHLAFAEIYNDLFLEVSEALEKPRAQRMSVGGMSISTTVTRRLSYFRQGLAGEPFVTSPDELGMMKGWSLLKEV
jgi:hypothetical protein